MRVLHINKHASGGAFNAAFHQHLALLASGVDSYFLTLGELQNNIPNHVVVPKLFHSRIRTFLNRFDKLRTRRRQHRLWLDEVGMPHPEIFTFPDNDYDLSKKVNEIQPDIINLHWVASFLDVRSFFRKVDRPIVWTLHDQNPFSGGFHYEEKDPQLLKAYEQLEKRNIEIKKTHYPDSMTISAPSKWLSTSASESQLMKDYQQEHIPYSLPTEIFKPSGQSNARQQLGLPVDKTLLFFVAEKVGVRRKGFDLLLEALLELEKRIDLNRLEIVAIGNKSKELEQYSFVRQFGYVNGSEEMAKLYNSADAFVMPSRKDNLPNVMLESVSCGTPVIAFNIGGVPDVIEEGVNGILAREVDAQSLAAAIERFLKGQDQFDRQKISLSAHQRFHFKVQGKAYKDLYGSLI